MAVSRRAFLRSGGLAAALVPMAPALMTAESLKAWHTAEPPAASGVHILGMDAVSIEQKLVKAMSIDVFDRLRTQFARAYPGRALQVSEFDKVGYTVPYRGRIPVTLTTQWNTGTKVASLFWLEPERMVFPVETFRATTAVWMPGAQMYLPSGSEPPTSIHEMFDNVRVVGMPIVPSGLNWGAHFVDESSGLVMRALSAFDIATDELLVRWDVICG